MTTCQKVAPGENWSERSASATASATVLASCLMQEKSGACISFTIAQTFVFRLYEKRFAHLESPSLRKYTIMVVFYNEVLC